MPSQKQMSINLLFFSVVAIKNRAGFHQKGRNEDKDNERNHTILLVKV